MSNKVADHIRRTLNEFAVRLDRTIEDIYTAERAVHYDLDDRLLFDVLVEYVPHRDEHLAELCRQQKLSARAQLRDAVLDWAVTIERGLEEQSESGRRADTGAPSDPNNLRRESLPSKHGSNGQSHKLRGGIRQQSGDSGQLTYRTLEQFLKKNRFAGPTYRAGKRVFACDGQELSVPMVYKDQIPKKRVQEYVQRLGEILGQPYALLRGHIVPIAKHEGVAR